MRAAHPELARVVVELRGTVQGVGFRPFVQRLANELGLAGSVRNRGGHVVVDLEGPPDRAMKVGALICERAPPGASIVAVAETWFPPRGIQGFAIEKSESDSTSGAFVPPDRATCDACEREFDDPSHRLYGYSLIACTDCGPRLSATTNAPFDRAATTLAAFPMCAACSAEHDDVNDRRLHAVMLACAHCGPRIHYWDRATESNAPRIEGRFAIDRAARNISKGAIGAVLGVGGYHLVCDAMNADALLKLRNEKSRTDKPFAVLFPNIDVLSAHCIVNDVERELLVSSARPIVLVEWRSPRVLPDAVAPRSPLCGAFLPPTALHRALIREVGRPLVLTSGNRRSEPMATTLDEARSRLGDIAEFFLNHERPIAQRVDDSVTRVVANRPIMLRRARGYAPSPIRMRRRASRPILGVGAELLCTIAIAIEDHAIVSQHIGGLENVATSKVFEQTILHYRALAGATPALLAHDMHPDFISTRWAIDEAKRTGARLIAVQHHHAHFAAALMEAEAEGPAIGVIFDGLGLGTDGALWGGEVLVGDMTSVRRYAHFRYVPMPGGDRATREGWRMAIAHLRDADAAVDPTEWKLSKDAYETALLLAKRNVAGPQTSSVGRLFDAVSAILGIRSHSTYEGQAAIELEWAAMRASNENAYPISIGAYGASGARFESAAPLEIDSRNLILAIRDDQRRGIAIERIARRFHETLANWVAEACDRARAETDLATVVLAGGVFANALLLTRARQRLEDLRFEVLSPTRVPHGDGSISLGQLGVAMAQCEVSPCA